MRERLRELDIRLTELADYLQISRPTLYKFIEYYENERYRPIEKSVLSLFRYIEDTPDIGKKNVMSFIIQNISNVTDGKNNDIIRTFTEYVKNPGVSKEKIIFINNVIKTSRMDELIQFFNKYFELMKKRSLTDDEQLQLNYFTRFKDQLIENETMLIQRSKTKRISKEDEYNENTEE